MTIAKKRFGQNFLHDPQVIHNIIAAIHCTPTDHIVEIGPGQRALTDKLLNAQRLDLIEIDNDLIVDLQVFANKHPNVHLHHTDVLKFDFASIADNTPLRIVGNLPYNISTPIIFHLLEYRELIHDLHFMLQKEVVERICAEPGSKTYGRLSVMTQYYFDVAQLFIVPPEAFTPRPKVESAIIRLIPHQKLAPLKHGTEHFEKLVAKAFSQRRKTIQNALKGLITPEQFTQLGINPQSRAEQLSLENYIALANL